MEETSTTSQPAWFQDALKKGLILGVLHIILFLVLYIAAPSKLTGFSYVFTILALNLGYCIYQGIAWRKEASPSGYISYGDAFKYAFIVLFFNGLLYIIFSMVFLLVQPDFPEQLANSQLDTSVYWAQKFGAPEESLEKIRDDFNLEEAKSRFGFSGLLFSFGLSLLFYAIGAAIVALFVRKSAPEVL
jgi:hypothetical protein